jgi:hypothetical protein
LKRIDALPVQHILTTNYDYLLEGVTRPSPRKASTREQKYSLFRWRKRTAGGKVWHVHGEAMQKASIMLGSAHYSTHTARVREYLSASPNEAGDWKRARARSPLITQPTEENTKFVRGWRRSWVDHFLTGHVHVLGFGFSQSETLLWWLLMFRHREAQRKSGPRFQPGSFTFYSRRERRFADGECNKKDVKIESSDYIKQAAHIKLLESFGVDVVQLGGGEQPSLDRTDFYHQAIDKIRVRIGKQP